MPGYNFSDGWLVRRSLVASCIAALLLTSCGQTPSLWGIYPTPTSEATYFTPLVPDTETPTAPPTSTPDPTRTFTPTPTLLPLESPTASGSTTPTPGTPKIETTTTPTFDVPAMLYYAQSGDTLPALAVRFGVDASEIRSDSPLPPTELVPPGTLLVVPDRITEHMTPNVQLIPDSELVFSATAINFNIEDYVKSANGKLSQSREYLGSTGWTYGWDEIKRLALENSINPRLLLGILDYESRWVHGQPVDALHTDYAMGYQNPLYKGLFSQMLWAVNQLSIGYYGWRTGALTELNFPDGTTLRLDPRLNAGTVAIQVPLLEVTQSVAVGADDRSEQRLPRPLCADVRGPVGARRLRRPAFPSRLVQPPLGLPFQPKIQWSYSGGPHGAWEHDGSLAAIDFAPATDHGGCDPTPTWVTASAPGLIVRSDHGIVVEDLDGDGYEQTGWDLVYLPHRYRRARSSRHLSAGERSHRARLLRGRDRHGHPPAFCPQVQRRVGGC